jgi:hypothetical protein
MLTHGRPVATREATLYTDRWAGAGWYRERKRGSLYRMPQVHPRDPLYAESTVLVM